MCGPSRKSSGVLILYADKAPHICSTLWFEPSSSACCRNPFLLTWAPGSRSADLLFLCSSTGSPGYPHLTFVVFFTMVLIWAPHLLPLTRALLFFSFDMGEEQCGRCCLESRSGLVGHTLCLPYGLPLPSRGKIGKKLCHFECLFVCKYMHIYV